MFYGCTSLRDGPSISAIELTSTCFQHMLEGCSRLSSVNVRFTAWSPSTATTNWLSAVSPTGVFKCPGDLPAERGASRIPEGWLIDETDIEGVGIIVDEDHVLKAEDGPYVTA